LITEQCIHKESAVSATTSSARDEVRETGELEQQKKGWGDAPACFSGTCLSAARWWWSV